MVTHRKSSVIDSYLGAIFFFDTKIDDCFFSLLFRLILTITEKNGKNIGEFIKIFLRKIISSQLAWSTVISECLTITSVKGLKAHA